MKREDDHILNEALMEAQLTEAQATQVNKGWMKSPGTAAPCS